ncbi:D-lactaldehyde dehydrogenase [Coprinopsis sp. MPI-PUGE-AT-0042]|nr:D-lactaldehyde dehydrogenase [Coprinopsis sp. MPI-PUGE-AT-0042]
MPTVAPGSKVLVTGANGFIAIWVVRRLLEKGYFVRGAVRSEGKGAYLKDYFKAYGDKLELVVVPDITQVNTHRPRFLLLPLTIALLRMAHSTRQSRESMLSNTASPFHGNVDHPDELIVPAVQGTVGVLKSALKNATTVKRIVITSSCAAIMNDTLEPSRFSEKDWNESSIKEVEQKGREADPASKYRASKTLAEKAAWAFYDENRDKVEWDISVLNPTLVFGPPIHEVSSPDALNTSLKSWWDNVVSDKPKTEQALAASRSWVDVRDLADGHVLALEKEAAGGERIIVVAGPFVWQEWLDIANAIQPPLLSNHKLPVGFPSIERAYKLTYDTTKEKRILGIKHRSKEEVTRDHLEDFAMRGW